MSFSVQLSQDLVTVEAGANTPFSITLINKGTEREQLELDVEGIDPEWKAVPVPVFTVEPGETHQERIFFRPPRASESGAGNYPFVVKVRSLITGEQKTCQGVLQLKPFHHVSMEIGPKKGSYSSTKKNNAFDLTIVNLSNVEHTVQLTGNDPEDSCAYDFEQTQVVVGPGQQKDVEVVVTPTQQKVFSSSRLIGFSVTARSVETPSVAASAQAQLEVRSLLSPSNVSAAVILLIIFLAWLFMMPKPPGVIVTIDPMQATVGDTVNVSWFAHDASRVTVSAGGTPIYDGPRSTGSMALKIDSEQMGTVEAVASREGQRSQSDIKHINIKVLVKAGAPEVLKFSADTKQVKLGTSFVIKYKFNPETVRARLAPMDKDLDPNLDQIEVTPTSVGMKQYSVVAYNKDGEASRPSSIYIDVVDVSDASIASFDANPLLVKPDDMRTTLSWTVYNAVQVKLEMPGAEPETVDSNVSNRVFTITGKTTFVLTAFDSKGRKTSKKVSVDVQKAPIGDPMAPPGALTPPVSGTGQ